MLRSDKILITKQGLEDLIQVLKDRTHLTYRTYKEVHRDLTPSEAKYLESIGKERKTKGIELPVYDATKPLNLKFKVLRDYLEDYEKWKVEQAELEKKNENKEKVKSH